MIKAILCDFGGVIGTDVDLIVEDIFEKNGYSRKIANSVWKKHWPILKIGSEPIEKYWADITKKIGNKTIATKIKKEAIQQMRVYPNVVKYLSSFRKKGYIVVIVSNESVEWMKIYQEKGNLNKKFDKIYTSGEMGIAKPQKEFFRFALEDQKVRSNQVIFIDNLERNTKIAETLGIKSILYSDIKSLKKEMDKILN